MQISDEDYFDIPDTATSLSSFYSSLPSEILFNILEKYNMPGEANTSGRGRGRGRPPGQNKSTAKVGRKTKIVKSRANQENLDDRNSASSGSEECNPSPLQLQLNITSETSPADIALMLNKLSTQLQEVTKMFEGKLAQVDKELKSALKQIDIGKRERVTIRTENEELSLKNAELQNKIVTLQQQARTLEIKSSNNVKEQVPIYKKIVLSGSAIKSAIAKSDIQCEVKSNINQVINNLLNVPLNDTEKIEYFSVGSKGDKIGAIIPEYNLKAAFFSQVRLLKPGGIFVNEYLTPQKSYLRNKLIKLRYEKECEFSSIFTFKGDVYIKKTVNSERILINQISDAMNARA